jgi:hypothetical protein
MPVLSRRFIPYAVACAAALGLTLTIGGAGLALAAAGGPQPGTPNNAPSGSGKALAAPALANPVMAAGSETKLITVAPCRIIDTRMPGAGGPLIAASRAFTADGPYTAQGGNAAGCGIPTTGLTAVLINVGALSYAGAAGWVKGWAVGATEPNASLVNYNKSGPIANMVTLPVNTSGDFNLKTLAKAHVYVDIAGYYVKPLYASIDGQGGTATVSGGVESGLVSVVRSGVGSYQLTFERNVTACVAVATDFLFTSVHEISIDSTFSGDSTIYVQVKNSSTGADEDTLFHVSLTC